ncbi:MAG: superfamily II DNA or RNA helicase [Faunusvirus sp.]|jgi:superfamily II DNA or RNA helicase|uniref:Superfamily II DNA or RNA helicase n=1 Tax=Faunusvirus sp. TaxID=2487766 RepID=A0A3G5A152_9VIRU|nr:MAG: superfamily II DNA or RNA helicase [Faunusvirus sp.]
MKTVLCKKGYILDKAQFDAKVIMETKAELNVRPHVVNFFNANQEAEPFPVFIENSKKISVPKYYGLSKFGQPELIVENEGVTVDVPFKGELRDYQIPIVAKIVAVLRGSGGGVLPLGCGKGKTTIGLKVFSEMKKKGLILVHKEFLVNQWIERIKQFLPTARIGKLQQNTVDTVDKDIVIGMLQSISMKTYDNSIFDEFGFVCVDECHHISSKVFSQALPKVATKYMLGLSATPEREDKLEKVLYWYMGPLIFELENQFNMKTIVKTYKYSCNHDKFKEVISHITHKPNVTKMVTNLSEIPERNSFLVSLINSTIASEPTRKCLILSSRVEHLKQLKKSFDDDKKYTTGLYIGKMKKDALKASESKDIIFASYQLAEEGLDIPALDTVLYATPRKKIKQSKGRIERKKEHEYINAPLILDIADKIRTFTNQSYVRSTEYRKCKYDIDIYDVENNIITHVKKIVADKSGCIKNTTTKNAGGGEDGAFIDDDDDDKEGAFIDDD